MTNGGPWPTLDELRDQERRLVLPSLDENDAIDIGLRLLQLAVDRDLAVTIEIRLAEQGRLPSREDGDRRRERQVRGRQGKGRRAVRARHAVRANASRGCGHDVRRGDVAAVPRVRPARRRRPADRRGHRPCRCRDRVRAPAAGRPRARSSSASRRTWPSDADAPLAWCRGSTVLDGRSPRWWRCRTIATGPSPCDGRRPAPRCRCGTDLTHGPPKCCRRDTAPPHRSRLRSRAGPRSARGRRAAPARTARSGGRWAW